MILFLWMLGMVVAPAAGAQPFVRHVEAGFVRDAEGVPYTHPWLGGLLVPRPHLVDIDADADADLFVQERSGRLMFFERVGSPATPTFRWRPTRFEQLEVGEWARFGDLDGDGDFDLLAEERFGLVRYYRNDGTPEAPRFVLAADPLGAVVGEGEAARDTLLALDRQSLAALFDIDCDGDDDLFAPNPSGTITFYRNLGPGDDGLPRLRFETDFFQDILIIGTFGKREAARHGATALDFIDVDNDGDLDLLWGDFFSPSLYLIENTGSCDAPRFRRASDVFPFDAPLMTRGYNVPASGDLDGDGREDLVVGVLGGAFAPDLFAGHNLYYYRHGAGSSFDLETRQLLSSLDVGEDAAPAFADLNADGSPDLLVGNRIDPVTLTGSQLFFFENAAPTALDLRLVTDAFVAVPEGRFNLAPALADLDDDDDFDLVLGTFAGSLLSFRNEGTPQQPQFVPAGGIFLPETIDVGQNSTPAFGDLDADGDVDLLIGEAGGTINFYRNDGTARQPNFVLQTERFLDFGVGSRSAPTLVDDDGDGDLDLWVGSELSGLFRLGNEGTPQEPAFGLPEPVTLPGIAPRLAVPAFIDLGVPGKPDLFLGVRTGGLLFFENDPSAIAIDEAPEQPAARVRLLPNHPNPFRSATQLSFYLIDPGPVRLTIYDVRGRAVATLADGLFSPGEHRLRFDAAPLPAGVYLARLTTPHGSSTRTMLLVR